MVDGNVVYDVFISYKTNYRVWVETLANNLENQGVRVFLDNRELIAGTSLSRGLYDSIKKSRKGIIVVTPGAFDSGWVKMEYDQMIIELTAGKNFTVIPVVAAKEVPDVAFMRTFLWVDFRDPAQYKESLYRLVCAVRDEEPGATVTLSGNVVVPEPIDGLTRPVSNEDALVRQLFDHFDSNRSAVVILAREDRWQECVRSLIMELGEKRFGNQNLLVIVPPIGTGAVSDRMNFFEPLGEQCGFKEPVSDAVSFLSAFRKHLGDGKKRLLVVRRIENCDSEGQRLLADALRSINDQFQEQVRILISGGEKLEDLVNGGVLSYLNYLAVIQWPEMSEDEAKRLCLEICSVRNLKFKPDDTLVSRILGKSGGHPGVLEQCLILHGSNPEFSDDELVDSLVTSSFICRLFMPFFKDSEQRSRLIGLLEQMDVAGVAERLRDPLIKGLYWKNVLKQGRADRRLYWRCDALRQAGREILNG